MKTLQTKMLQADVLKKRKATSKKMEFVKDCLTMLGALGATAGWIAFCELYVDPQTEVAKKESRLESSAVQLLDECSEKELSFARIKNVYVNADKTITIKGIVMDNDSSYVAKAKIALDDENFSNISAFVNNDNKALFDLAQIKSRWNLSSYDNFITVLNSALCDEDTLVVNYEESSYSYTSNMCV